MFHKVTKINHPFTHKKFIVRGSVKLIKKGVENGKSRNFKRSEGFRQVVWIKDLRKTYSLQLDIMVA